MHRRVPQPPARWAPGDQVCDAPPCANERSRRVEALLSAGAVDVVVAPSRPGRGRAREAYGAEERHCRDQEGDHAEQDAALDEARTGQAEDDCDDEKGCPDRRRLVEAEGAGSEDDQSGERAGADDGVERGAPSSLQYASSSRTMARTG